MPRKKATSRKKKTGRRGRPPKKSFTQAALDELDDLDEEQEDLEDLLADAEAEEGENDEDSLDEPIRPDQKIQDGEDVLDYGNRLTNEGTPVYYYIRRDGQILAPQVDAPFTWDELKRQFGGGVYQITVKEHGSNKIRTRKVQTLAGARKYNFAGKGVGSEEEEAATQQQKPESLTMQDVLGLMEKTKSETERSIKENMHSEKESQQSLQMMMIQMFTQSQQNMTQMIQQSTQQTNEMLRTMQENTNNMMMRMQDSGKKDLGLTELLALINSSGDKEIKKYITMMEHLESRASDKEAIYRELAEIKAGSVKDKSGVDTLIETLGPALAQALAAKQSSDQQGAAAAAATAQGQNVVSPQEMEYRRRVLLAQKKREEEAARARSQSQTQKEAHARKAGVSQQTTPQVKPDAQDTAAFQPPESVKSRSLTEEEQQNYEKLKSQIASDEEIDEDSPMKEKEHEERAPIDAEIVDDDAGEIVDDDAGTVLDQERVSEVIEEENIPLKRRIEELLTAKVVAWFLIPGKRTDQAAVEALIELEKNGITREQVAASYQLSDLMKIGHQYNLPHAKIEWIKEFWGHVETQLQRPGQSAS